MVLLDLAIGGLTKALEASTEALKAGLDLANKSQKTSLALGMTLKETRVQLGSSLDDLRGSIDGKLAAGIAGLESGLQGNTGGILKLVNQQMLTGQSWRGTTKMFSKLISVGGLQQEAANEMAKQLIKNANTYGVTTKLLIGSLGNLEDRFATLNMAGMGKSITESVVKLQAQVGPQMQQSLNKALNLILQTGTKGMTEMAAFGLTGVREELHAARGDSAKTFEILRNAVLTADRANRDRVGEDATLFQQGIMSEALGFRGEIFSVLAEALTSNARFQNEKQANAGDQISVMVAEIFNPFKEAMLDIFVLSFPTIKKVSEELTGVVTRLTTKGIAWFDSMGGLAGITVKLKEKWNDWLPTLTDVGGALSSLASILIDTIQAVNSFFSFFSDANAKEQTQNQKGFDKAEGTAIDKIFGGYKVPEADRVKQPDTKQSNSGPAFLKAAARMQEESMEAILGTRQGEQLGLLETMATALEHISMTNSQIANKQDPLEFLPA